MINLFDTSEELKPYIDLVSYWRKEWHRVKDYDSAYGERIMKQIRALTERMSAIISLSPVSVSIKEDRWLPKDQVLGVQDKLGNHIIIVPDFSKYCFNL